MNVKASNFDKRTLVFYDLYDKFVQAMDTSDEESLIQHNSPLNKAYWKFMEAMKDEAIKGGLVEDPKE